MSGKGSSSGPVSESQIYGWRHRVREIDEEIRTLSAERDKLGRLIGMAEELVAEARLLEQASDSHSIHPRFITNALEALSSTDDYPTAVMLIAERADDGVTYDELREAILLSPLGPRFRKSDKGFYHALSRAKGKGALVEHRGYVFTPGNLAAFQRKVAAGLKEDKVAARPPAGTSPMMDAILDVVARHPGLTPKEIVIKLRDGSPAHDMPPLKSEGSAFNAISRLRQRGEIEGFGHQERQLRIGSNASEELKRLARSGVVVPLKTNTAASQ